MKILSFAPRLSFAPSNVMRVIDIYLVCSNVMRRNIFIFLECNARHKYYFSRLFIRSNVMRVIG